METDPKEAQKRSNLHIKSLNLFNVLFNVLNLADSENDVYRINIDGKLLFH